MDWHDKRFRILAFVLAVLLIIIGARIFMNIMSSRERAEKATQGKAVAVPTGFAKRETIKPVLTFAGNLDPVWQAKIASKIAGRIQSVLVNEGDYVEAGTVLAALDSSEIDATVNAARGSVYDAKANLEQAATTLARYQRLLEKGAISQQEVDNASFARDMAAGKLESAQGTYENAYSRMEGTRVITPHAGYVVKRYYQEGYYAKDTDALFNVADISTLLVKINIPEGQIGSVAIGSVAEIEVPAMPGKKFQGKVTKIAAVADAPGRTFASEVSIPNSDGLLRGGVYANVYIKSNDKPNALVVPQSAIVMREDQRTVFVLDKDNFVKRKVLTTGYIGNGLVEVLGGLEENERIIIGGQNKIREGSKVKIDEAGSEK
ncbi:MAG: efflux RND transporter periplasmic adaptor subunit [Negativicutes bacterium]|nr:efflux RND transporter periplasmic adaptor subunit [Negativicutes bacterium]